MVGSIAAFLVALGVMGGSGGFVLDLVFLVVIGCLASYLLSVPRQLLKKMDFCVVTDHKLLEVQTKRQKPES